MMGSAMVVLVRGWSDEEKVMQLAGYLRGKAA